MLDALLIAAAVVGLSSDRLLLIAANARMHDAARHTVRGEAESIEAVLSRAGPIAQLLHAYLEARGIGPDELEFCDGSGLEMRHYRMKLGPLPIAADGTQRCLVSVVDRTLEVQAERTLRAEMMRDSLTGLPNRLGFTDMIEKATLLEQGARDPIDEHAVLVVDLRRFSRINERMGSLVGDELLITFARRLISTLRNGDVLARTGQ